MKAQPSQPYIGCISCLCFVNPRYFVLLLALLLSFPFGQRVVPLRVASC
nr:MAG TPA: hypothetical protein [Caudoviricetes sp.]